MNFGPLVVVPRSTPTWSEPEWLAEWIRTPFEPPPASAEEIRAAIAEVAVWLSPAPQLPSAYFEPLGRLFGLPDNWPDQVDLYDEALAGLPDWALIEAVHNCVGHCRFFPKPIEIRDRLPVQLSLMRDTKLRLELAQWRLQRAQRDG